MVAAEEVAAQAPAAAPGSGAAAAAAGAGQQGTIIREGNALPAFPGAAPIPIQLPAGNYTVQGPGKYNVQGPAGGAAPGSGPGAMPCRRRW